MRSRIWVDATTIIERVDGLSQYIINLLKYMPEEAFDKFDISVLINPNIPRKDLKELINSGKYKFIYISIAPIGPRRDWDMFWFLQKNKGKFDIFHNTSSQYPLFLKGGIATIHDLTFKKFQNTSRRTFGLSKYYLNRVIRHSVKNADAIITVSQFTCNDLLSYYPRVNGLKQKTVVIHEGWEHLECKQPEGSLSVNPPCNNYFFYLGSARIHKNLSRMIDAFELALPQIPDTINLLISGEMLLLKEKDKKKVFEINKNKKRVFFSGIIPQEELPIYFKHAKAFVFPSLSEGFGLPILESFYFNIPILCSQTTSFPEIAGDAALFFDPLDIKSIADSIIKIINDSELADSIVRKGKERIIFFSWKKTAAQVLDVYHKLNKKN